MNCGICEKDTVFCAHSSEYFFDQEASDLAYSMRIIYNNSYYFIITSISDFDSKRYCVIKNNNKEIKTFFNFDLKNFKKIYFIKYLENIIYE